MLPFTFDIFDLYRKIIRISTAVTYYDVKI